MGNVQKNTQQKISEDYKVPEEIASAALLMLQEMSQPNPQEPDDNDKYALPVGTERLPDIVSEMNEERGIKNVVNYDADITEEMKLQIDELRLDPDEPKGERMIKLTKSMKVMRPLSMMPVNLMIRIKESKNQSTNKQMKGQRLRRVN